VDDWTRLAVLCISWLLARERAAGYILWAHDWPNANNISVSELVAAVLFTGVCDFDIATNAEPSISRSGRKRI